jgi:hypothetical protein
MFLVRGQVKSLGGVMVKREIKILWSVCMFVFLTVDCFVSPKLDFVFSSTVFSMLCRRSSAQFRIGFCLGPTSSGIFA